MPGLRLSFEYITLREASEQTGGEEGEVGEVKKACMRLTPENVYPTPKCGGGFFSVFSSSHM